MNSIGIIGCGWLGLPLATSLVKDGYLVHGSTTSESKMETLKTLGIIPHLIKLSSELTGTYTEELFLCDAYVINIPPGRKDADVMSSYPKKISTLLHKIKNVNAKIIFISTTGVYPDNGLIVDENTTPNPDKESSKAVLAAEQVVQSSTNELVILRMAGLIGGTRQPGNWFSGKQNVSGGDTPVNMVHQEDCIAIVKKILSSVFCGEIYNVCADEHPKKRHFYRIQSEKIGVKPPTWERGVLPYKIVSNAKIKEDLKYEYLWPDPMAF